MNAPSLNVRPSHFPLGARRPLVVPVIYLGTLRHDFSLSLQSHLLSNVGVTPQWRDNLT